MSFGPVRHSASKVSSPQRDSTSAHRLGFVRPFGMLERGVDDRAEPGGRAARVAAEIADDPVELALLERVQPRRRHPHVLDREIAQGSGRGGRPTPYHSRGAAPAHAGVGERPRARSPSARRGGPRGRPVSAPAMLRHQTAQRQRVIDGVRLGVGQELEEDTGPVSSSSTAVTRTLVGRAATARRAQTHAARRASRPAAVERAGGASP